LDCLSHLSVLKSRMKSLTGLAILPQGCHHRELSSFGTRTFADSECH
jgi:hypothetical protein